MIINITPTTVIESTIMYGIVHAVWIAIKWFALRAGKEIRAERNRIIRQHVKDGHVGRLKHCPDIICLSLQKPAQQPVQELPVLHTES